MISRICVGALASLILAGLLPSPVVGQATAQSWPTKPIKLVVPFTAGGGTDLTARTLAEKLGEYLGQNVVVENRAGASGVIGADAVAKAAPDGYTFLLGQSIPNAIAPNVIARMPYDAANDFTPISYIGYLPNVLVIPSSLPVKSVDELVAYAKRSANPLTYSSSGIGSTHHLAAAAFAKLKEIRLNHIPYKGSSQALPDMLSGAVVIRFDTITPVRSMLDTGRLVALAVSTTERLPNLASVPTFQEAGIGAVDVANWYALLGPKALPGSIVSKLAAATRAVFDDPEIQRKLEPQGYVYSGPRTPEELGAFIRSEIFKYGKLVKELDIQSQ